MADRKTHTRQRERPPRQGTARPSLGQAHGDDETQLLASLDWWKRWTRAVQGSMVTRLSLRTHILWKLAKSVLLLTKRTEPSAASMLRPFVCLELRMVLPP